jgi:hypothetical protein
MRRTGFSMAVRRTLVRDSRVLTALPAFAT